MMVSEALVLANEELKRADHSIAVSLKYTRTVDVIKSIVERLIGSIGFSIEALLIHAKEQGKIEEVNALPRLRVDQVLKLYPDDKIIDDFCKFYLTLRKIDKAEFGRAQEYRRHVTMTAKMDGEKAEITIDIISDYFDRTKEFLQYVSGLIKRE